MAAKESRKATEASMLKLLEQLHRPPAWAFLRQVAPGTGWSREQRWADAVAMSLWPSRGLEVHGFEVKVARSDWLRELKDPKKAEAVAAFCDRWWIVAPPGVVEPAELPPLWGLYEQDGRKLKARRKAEAAEAKPIDRAFLASMLRRVYEAEEARRKEMIDPADIEERIEQAEAAGKATAEGALGYELQRLRGLEKRVETFEREAGVQIDRWGYGQVGEDVRRLTALREAGQSVETAFEVALIHAKRAVERLERAESEARGERGAA